MITYSERPRSSKTTPPRGRDGPFAAISVPFFGGGGGVPRGEVGPKRAKFAAACEPCRALSTTKLRVRMPRWCVRGVARRSWRGKKVRSKVKMVLPIPYQNAFCHRPPPRCPFHYLSRAVLSASASTEFILLLFFFFFFFQLFILFNW